MVKRIRARRRPGDEPPQRLADALAHLERLRPSYTACRSCGRETCWIGARHARQPERPVRPFPTIEHPACWQDREAVGADVAVLTPEVLADAAAAIRNAPAFVIVDVFAAYREREDP